MQKIMIEGLTIAVPSWKRANTAFTHKYLSSAQYVVCESQADSYRKNGLNVWECPDQAQGNLCRVRNWILDNCKTKWLVLLDDDLLWLGRWNGNTHKKMTEDEAIEAIEASFILAEDIGVPFWGIQVSPDKAVYREFSPFSLNNYIGGPFQAFVLPEFDLNYDEDLPLKEDYDLTLQVANKWRKVLRVNFLHYNVKQQEGVGGCATMRTLDKERQQFEALQKKWGSKIVRADTRRMNGAREKMYDINPVIKVPISGL
jgi:hypothetical protein